MGRLYRDDLPKTFPGLNPGLAEASVASGVSQGASFAWTCGGLDAAGLRATLGTSSMTLGGMLNHLARFEDDMSTEWLHGRDQLPPWNAVDWDREHDWDWRTAATDAPEQRYGGWQAAIDRARALFAEAVAVNGASRPTGRGLPGLGYILVNMIEEYARHNGHAGHIRESIDGLVGHDPPE